MAFGLSPARALAGYKADSRKIVLGYRVEEGEIVSRSLNFLCGADAEINNNKQRTFKLHITARKFKNIPLESTSNSVKI